MVKPFGDLNTKFFTSNSVSVEAYWDKGGFSGMSNRIQSKIIDTKFGGVKVMPMFNTDKNMNVSEQFRLTTYSPCFKLADTGDAKFSASAELRTTFKFDDKFKKTDLMQEPRLIFGAKKGDYSASVVPRLRYTQSSGKMQLHDVMLSAQKKFGKISAYAEAYFMKDAFKYGDLGATNFATGVCYNF